MVHCNITCLVVRVGSLMALVWAWVVTLVFKLREELVEIMLSSSTILRCPTMVLGGGAINFRLQSHPVKDAKSMRIHQPTLSFWISSPHTGERSWEAKISWFQGGMTHEFRDLEVWQLLPDTVAIAKLIKWFRRRCREGQRVKETEFPVGMMSVGARMARKDLTWWPSQARIGEKRQLVTDEPVEFEK